MYLQKGEIIAGSYKDDLGNVGYKTDINSSSKDISSLYRIHTEEGYYINRYLKKIIIK